jgi:hypothetical protein
MTNPLRRPSNRLISIAHNLFRPILEVGLLLVIAATFVAGLTTRSSGSPLAWYYGGPGNETIFVELGESIQAAIDAASDGWTIDLAYGVHYGQDIDLRGKRIRLRGAIGVDGYGLPYGLSTIRPIGYARVFDIHQGEGPDTTIEHLVIERGWALVESGYDRGAGMLIRDSSPTLRNCTFRENVAILGGGLAIDLDSAPTIIDCDFELNRADHGGGIAVLGNSAPFIERVILRQNAAYGQPIGNGGGILADSSTSAVVVDGVICGNFPDQVHGPVIEDGDLCVNESCDIDCNGNGVCDSVDIAIGASSDCDGDGVPDECRLTEEAGFFGSLFGFPFQGNTFEYSIPGRANALPVRIGIVAEGDLDESSEYLTLSIGGFQQRVETPYSCDVTEYFYEIPAANWNAAVEGSLVRFSIGSTGAVDYRCQNWIRFRVTYPLPDENDTDGDGAGDCVDPCPTIPYDCDADSTTLVLEPGMNIQSAIDTFPETTTIELVAGTYRVLETINPQGRPIRFVGAVDAEGRPATILDGEGARRLIECGSGETPATVFENLVIANGDTNWYEQIDNGNWDAIDHGGGVHLSNASPTFVNCDFVSCTASSWYIPGGGAVASGGGEPVFSRCRFGENQVQDGYQVRGGAVLLHSGSRARFHECEFTENLVLTNDWDDRGFGGAVASMQSFPIFTACSFVENGAQSSTGIDGAGGAIYALGGEVDLRDCVFFANVASRGGAIHMTTPDDCTFASDSFLTISGCEISGNQATSGGGIMITKFGDDDYDPDCPSQHDLIATILDTQVHGNAGQGIAITSPLHDDPDTTMVTITGGSVADNFGYDNGGGIAVQNATLIIDGVTVERNFATYGAGMHAGAGSVVDVVAASFQSNTALQGGGILGFLPDRLSLQSTLVCLNAPNQIVGGFEDLGDNCIGTLCLDSDGDDTLDCADECPEDPEKTEPGICGCGVPDTDSDADGTVDCFDLCPDDPTKTSPGECGCGNPDTDSDGDGIADCNDPCPEWPYDCTDGGSTLIVQPGQPIQQAIVVARSGDMVRLAAGTHMTSSTLSLLGKAIALAGETDGSGEPLTTLDAGGDHRVITCNTSEGTNTVIRDLVITGGNQSAGGGIYLSSASPRIIGCRIELNTALIGGGLYCSAGSQPQLMACRIEQNTAADLGGGVFSSPNSHPTFVDSRVCGNSPDQINGPFEQAGDSCENSMCDACFNACPADLDGNGVVSGGDLGLLLVAWGPCGSGTCPADLDGDGVVGGSDLGVFLVNIGPCDGD